METAYEDAAGRGSPDYIELGSGVVDGLDLRPGLYTWGGDLSIPASLTLTGGPNDVWIFQVGRDLRLGDGAMLTLAGGAQARNVFWQVARTASIGPRATLQGIVLTRSLIAMDVGSTLHGRALAKTSVSLDGATVTTP
jgi:hypothetical protein